MKKYQASSMAEALAAIRAELGPNAMILHSSELRRGPLGILARPMVEVVAGVDDAPALPPSKAAPARPPARPPRARPTASTAQGARRAETARADSEGGSRDLHRSLVAGRAAEVLEAIAAGRQPIEPSALREMQQHVRELRATLSTMMQTNQWPGTSKLARPLLDLYQRLLDQEVSVDLAQELVTTIDSELSLQAASDPATVIDSVAKHLRRMLPTSGPLTATPGAPVVLFLIGPTGVGKTTTIAKLAATLALQRQSVALVTCDTYRVAAIPQLRTYADILRIPIEVAYTSDELTGKVFEHVEKDFIIVDTPGRSQRNADQLADLRRFVMAIPARRTFLTVTAGSRYRDMLDVVGRFGTIPFDGLLITKLDETTSFGPIVNLVRQTGRPVTYLTNGQNVPHDIAVASADGLTTMLLGAAYGTPAAPPATESVA